MKDFLEAKPGVNTIGFGAYPDGHATISKGDLHTAVIEKEALLKVLTRGHPKLIALAQETLNAAKAQLGIK